MNDSFLNILPPDIYQLVNGYIGPNVAIIKTKDIATLLFITPNLDYSLNVIRASLNHDEYRTNQIEQFVNDFGELAALHFRNAMESKEQIIWSNEKNLSLAVYGFNIRFHKSILTEKFAKALADMVDLPYSYPKATIVENIIYCDFVGGVITIETRLFFLKIRMRLSFKKYKDIEIEQLRELITYIKDNSDKEFQTTIYLNTFVWSRRQFMIMSEGNTLILKADIRDRVVGLIENEIHAI